MFASCDSSIRKSRGRKMYNLKFQKENVFFFFGESKKYSCSNVASRSLLWMYRGNANRKTLVLKLEDLDEDPSDNTRVMYQFQNLISAPFFPEAIFRIIQYEEYNTGIIPPTQFKRATLCTLKTWVLNDLGLKVRGSCYHSSVYSKILYSSSGELIFIHIKTYSTIFVICTCIYNVYKSI